QDHRARFWATYNSEAAEYDNEFLEKYKGDMDIVLIFSGLFSAVNTSFIVAMEPNLGPNPTVKTNHLLEVLIHAVSNSTYAAESFPIDIPPWSGPGISVIWVQTLIYASLAASLLAALGAVLGKQW
ncbi:hypothetical protein BV22DRAFT_977004, partial [Leucogyrophana mollusca]